MEEEMIECENCEVLFVPDELDEVESSNGVVVTVCKGCLCILEEFYNFNG